MNLTLYLDHQRSAGEFVSGTYESIKLARLLSDLHHPEVAHAFASAIRKESEVTRTAIRPLGVEFGLMLDLAALINFGSNDASVVDAWFFGDVDRFVGEFVHATLRFYDTNAWTGSLERRFRNVLRAVFDIVVGCQPYMSIEVDDPAHAVVYALQFIKNSDLQSSQTPFNRASHLLMEEIAERLLNMPHRAVCTFEHGFGLVAGCEAWRNYLSRAVAFANGRGQSPGACERLQRELDRAQEAFARETTQSFAKRRRTATHHVFVPLRHDCDTHDESEECEEVEEDVDAIFRQADSLRGKRAYAYEHRGSAHASDSPVMAPSPLPTPPTRDTVDSYFLKVFESIPKALVCG